MISSLSWVKKGCAQRVPTKQEFNQDEFDRITQHLQAVKMDAPEGLEMEPKEPEQPAPKDEDDLAIYNLDDYDNEPQQEQVSMFSNIKGLAYYTDNTQDPYIEIKDEEDDLQELEEMHIEASDNLLLACKTEDEVSHLEVYVYEEEEDNLYVHHDIMLPSFPLCAEWLDYPLSGGREKGNYVAIGTFDPQVEIWDLDTVDAMFPAVILGQIPEAGLNVSSKKKHGPSRVAKRPQQERHVDAVMAISWNSVQRNLIATGSADTTIKLWDLNSPASAVASYNHHTDKVQAVVWNKNEPTVLVSGGYDKRACAFDSRAPDTVAEWKLTADVECIKWDPTHAERFYVTSEDGIVTCFDVRAPGQPALFTLHAHDGAVTSLDVNPYLPGCFVTGSVDKEVKVWSITDSTPKCIASRDVDAGNVFSTNFSPDSPYIVAIGGSKGKVVVWNLENNSGVRRAYPPSKFGRAEESERPEFTKMDSDEEVDDDDEDEEADDMEEGDYSEEEEADHV